MSTAQSPLWLLLRLKLETQELNEIKCFFELQMRKNVFFVIFFFEGWVEWEYNTCTEKKSEKLEANQHVCSELIGQWKENDHTCAKLFILNVVHTQWLFDDGG